MAREAEVEVEVEEAEAKLATATLMQDQELVSREPTSKVRQFLIPTESRRAASRDRLEMHIHSTDNLVLVEVPESLEKRRVALARATGETNLTTPTSKVVKSKKEFQKVLYQAKSLKLRMMINLRRLRKKRSRSRKLRRSSSVSGSMIS